MEVLEGDALYSVIYRKYVQDQRGWLFRVSPSPKNGFFDGFVANRDEAWRLKLDTIFKPSPIVVGASVGAEGLLSSPGAKAFPFGFRELKPSLAQELSSREEGAEISDRVTALLASMKPVVPRPGKAYAQGPFILSQGGPVTLSRSQAELDERLSSEVLRRVRARYPSYG